MRPDIKRIRWSLIYVFFLALFTAYVVLDTFVITRVYTVVPSEGSGSVTESAGDKAPAGGQEEANEGPLSGADSDDDTGSLFTQTAVVTENSYSDQNINITIAEYREYDTTIYVAEVYVSSAEYLQTAFAKQAYGRNVTEETSEIARANNAILAVNGDYYGVQTKGYVLRNGVLYRETYSENQEDLVIWKDGSFEIITEGEIAASQLLEQGAAQILSFGPSLVLDGDISVTESDEVGKAKASNPRTAIGIVDDLHYMFVVSDGRTDESKGLTLYQLARFMEELGVETAYNLDGGGSSTMYFNGAVINNPTSSGKRIEERKVSDIVYIGS